MKLLKSLLPILILLQLTSCSTSPAESELVSQFQTARAQTVEAFPTPLKFIVPQANSPLPTLTRPSTPTISQTQTNTPVPTSTRAPERTPTPLPPGELISAALNAPQTASAEKTIAAAEKMEYKTVGAGELKSNADNFKGQKIAIQGRVIGVSRPDFLQLLLEGTYEVVLVKSRAPITGIYNGNNIIIYGVGAGQECGTNSSGARICQPVLEKAFFSILYALKVENYLPYTYRIVFIGVPYNPVTRAFDVPPRRIYERGLPVGTYQLGLYEITDIANIKRCELTVDFTGNQIFRFDRDREYPIEGCR
jgi:hypothetical protein